MITLALVNGRVWTGSPSQPSAEAVAIAGDRFAAVGTTADIRARAGSAEIVDLGGQFVVPGFIDTHVHFLTGGFRLASVQLRDAATKEEFIARITKFAAGVPAGTWITGGDWDHTLWGGELPRRDWIDAAGVSTRAAPPAFTPTPRLWAKTAGAAMQAATAIAIGRSFFFEFSMLVPLLRFCGGSESRLRDAPLTGSAQHATTHLTNAI